jgi:hypothetical protein
MYQIRAEDGFGPVVEAGRLFPHAIGDSVGGERPLRAARWFNGGYKSAFRASAWADKIACTDSRLARFTAKV